MPAPVDPAFWRGTCVTGFAVAQDIDPNLFTLERQALGWSDRLIRDDAVRANADRYPTFVRGDDMAACARRSIEDHPG